jgi:hypothetical protein
MHGGGTEGVIDLELQEHPAHAVEDLKAGVQNRSHAGESHIMTDITTCSIFHITTCQIQFQFLTLVGFLSPANCHQPVSRAVGHPCNPCNPSHNHVLHVTTYLGLARTVHIHRI